MNRNLRKHLILHGICSNSVTMRYFLVRNNTSYLDIKKKIKIDLFINLLKKKWHIQVG